VWCITTAKFTSMIERVHSKFSKKLPPSCASKLSFTLTKHRHFHAAFQVFRSFHNFSPSYFQNIFQAFVDKISIVSLFQKLLSWQKKFLILQNSLSSTVVEAAPLTSFKCLYFYCNCLCCLLCVCLLCLHVAYIFCIVIYRAPLKISVSLSGLPV